ncbi:hypothetical protein DIE03_01725 [Burkholderia sp. Bp8992]|nr:hypothetical protein DIE03_01725 [Burkholderia sp. Bp8992]
MIGCHVIAEHLDRMVMLLRESGFYVVLHPLDLPGIPSFRLALQRRQIRHVDDLAPHFCGTAV